MPYHHASSLSAATSTYPSLARPRSAIPLPEFEGEEVRVVDVPWPSDADGFTHAGDPSDDVLLVVQGGTVLVHMAREAPALLDPAHAFLVQGQVSIHVRRLSAGTRCTLLVVPGDRTPVAGYAADPWRSRSWTIPLGVSALFHCSWLRHALTGAAHRPADVASGVRAIHAGALARADASGAAGADSPRRRAARRALADGARIRLSASVETSHPLADVARDLHASPFHLAHVFREEVGQSLHQYLVRLRLITALDRLSAGAPDLSMLALDLGFSNHSHFSVAFRRTFGVSPRDARRRLTSATLPAVAPDCAEAETHPHTRCG